MADQFVVIFLIIFGPAPKKAELLKLCAIAPIYELMNEWKKIVVVVVFPSRVSSSYCALLLMSEFTFAVDVRTQKKSVFFRWI